MDGSAVLVLGFVAGALGVAAGWPQTIRLLRTRMSTGVSMASGVLGLATVTLWLAHGVESGDRPQTVSNALAIVAAALTVVCLLWLARDRRERILGVGLTLLACVAIVPLQLYGTGLMISLAATAASVSRQIPQVVVAMTPGRSLVGLSPGTIATGLTCSSLWLVYGLIVGDGAVFGVSVFATLCNLLLAYRRVPPRVFAQHARRGRFGPGVARVLGTVEGSRGRLGSYRRVHRAGVRVPRTRVLPARPTGVGERASRPQRRPRLRTRPATRPTR